MTIKFQVTAGELLAKYKQRLENQRLEDGLTIYLCYTIQSMQEEKCYADSTDVIEQFMLAKPERFLKSLPPSRGVNIRNYLLKKYRFAKQPRLNLLQAIPPEHVFTFTLDK